MRTVMKVVGVMAGATTALMALVVILAAVVLHPAHAASDAALREIPGPYRAMYQNAAAQRCSGLPWSVLAGVGKVESDHGSLGGAHLQTSGDVSPPIVGPVLDGTGNTQRIPDTDQGRFDGDVRFDRAVGPMQFLPSTWRRYGTDASGDGIADPHNAMDAIDSAAIYLCDQGASEPDGLRRALFSYNRSSAYVDSVLFHAARYGWATSSNVPASPDLITAVLTNPRLDIYAAGRQDIEAGRIDARVLALLQLASTRYTLTITSLKTRHSRCVGGGDYPGCRESHHWHGRGVDIGAVDGRVVSRTNARARELTLWLIALTGELAPSEIGVPWRDLDSGDGVFADRAHLDHVHLGFDAKGR